MQETDIYAAKDGGLFRYNARENALELVIPADIREANGKRDFVENAPVNLIYAADLSCAPKGPAAVVRGMFDPDRLSKAMQLRPGQKIILTQTAGYPK